MVKKFKTPIFVFSAIVLGFFATQALTLLRPRAEGGFGKTPELESQQSKEAPPSPAAEPVLAETDKSEAGVQEGAGGASIPDSRKESPSPENTPGTGAAKNGNEGGEIEKTNENKSSSKDDEFEEAKLRGDGKKTSDTKSKAPQGDRDRAKVDEYGFEVVDSEGGDFIEIERRLLALEQAFSVDGRRNKARGASMNWEADGEISRINESLSNLYQIVEQMPSIDTLQAKMEVVDGAIAEMNDTIEAINAVAKKIQGSEVDGAFKASGEAVQAANEALGEVKKISEAVDKLHQDLGDKDETVKIVKTEIEQKSKDLDETLEGQNAKIAEIFQKMDDFEKKVDEVTSTMSGVKGEVEAMRTKQDSVIKNIALLDKNIRVLSSSYKMVYDNALRVDGRLADLEKDGENSERRILLLENNLLPPE